MIAQERELRERICEIGRCLWLKGMVAANDGNISVRLGEDRILCTPTGTSKGFLRPELLPIVDSGGEIVEFAGVQPSSEMKMHLRVYATDPSVRAVVHAHPPFATLWAVKGRSLTNRMLPEAIVAMGDVPLAPYATPSTEGVGDSIAGFVTGHRACLLEHHGALTWGPDLMTAYLGMERVEYTAHLEWALALAGGGRDLPDEEIAALHRTFGGTY